MGKRLSTYHKRRMEIALAYIEDHFTRDLLLEEVSNACGMSKFHFTRVFKDHAGCSFKSHLNRRRVNHAKELLMCLDLSITEVCLDSGFNDLSYFDRVFRRLEGMSPTAFRLMHFPDEDD